MIESLSERVGRKERKHRQTNRQAAAVGSLSTGVQEWNALD